MGKVLSVISRKARRFNAENRAHRHLDKDKLEAAPKFKSNISDFHRVLEENPNFLQHESKKNSALDDRLKQVYVTSTDHVVQTNSPDEESRRPLPLDRKAAEDYEYGYLEPDKVRPGRATLRQALTFISSHQTEPQIWTNEKISAEYKLKPNIVDSILKHFYTFEVYIPEKKGDDKLLLKDRLKNLMDDEPKQLPPPKFDADPLFERLQREHTENQEKIEKEKEAKRAKIEENKRQLE